MPTTSRQARRPVGRERCVTHLIVALALTGTLATEAAAQSSPFSSDERTTAGWIFTPGAAVGGLWDSGINTSSNPVVESVFQRWVGTVNPFAELDFHGRRSHFSVGYSGAIEKYWESDTNWERRSHLSFSRALTRRFSLSIDGSYSAVPTTDRLQLTQGVIPYVKLNSSWFNAGGGLHYALTERTSADVNYRFESVVIDNRPDALALVGTLRDGFSHTPSVGVTRALSERLSIGGRGEFRREYVYDVDRTFDIQSGTGEFSYQVSPRTSISGGAGVSWLQLVDTQATRTSPTYHFGFSHATRLAKLDANYQHSFQPLFGFGSIGNTDSFSASATVPLDEDHVYFLKAEASYNRSDPINEFDIGFDFDTLWLNASVSRQLNSWVRAEGFISVSAQTSDTLIWPGGTNRHRIGIQLVTSKPLRIK